MSECKTSDPKPDPSIGDRYLIDRINAARIRVCRAGFSAKDVQDLPIDDLFDLDAYCLAEAQR